MATTAAIVLVGGVYSVALRALWQPAGWQAVADHALHDATPPFFFLAWAFSEHGSLPWRDSAWAVAIPILYGIYALVRGTLDGWYAYWFLNPIALSATDDGEHYHTANRLRVGRSRPDCD